MFLILFAFTSCGTQPQPEKKPEVVVEEIVYEESAEPFPETPSPNTEPFTTALLADLGYVMPPFFLSGEITLTREYSKEEISLENGTVIIQGLRDGNRLKFEPYAKGNGLRIEPGDNEILIYVGFIKSDGTQDTKTLIFSSEISNPNGLFYLRTNKETIDYGGQEFSIQYGEELPYLLVPVLRPDDIETGAFTTFPGIK
jgi:hypothetical protein